MVWSAERFAIGILVSAGVNGITVPKDAPGDVVSIRGAFCSADDAPSATMQASRGSNVFFISGYMVGDVIILQ